MLWFKCTTPLAITMAFALGWSLVSEVHAQGVDVPKLAEKVKAIGSEGKGHADAVAAIAALQKADAKQLPAILAAMDGANPLALNWFRVCAESVAGRAGKDLPQKELEAFLKVTNHHPRARRLAYELLAKADASVEGRLIPQMLDDPSLELRRDAVAMAIQKAETLATDGKKTEAAEALLAVFAKSRDIDQIDAIAKRAKELGGDDFAKRIDIAGHLGFLTRWRIIGPFENGSDKGWDVAYEPEKTVDLTATYTGQKGEVAWKEHTTADEWGTVDLNTFLDKHKGAIAYAVADFDSPKEQEVEIRYGCINATKLWLNGEFVTANHVYHAGTDVDQYSAKVKLKAGANRILLKIAQNEQTEPWAQRWQFQVRVCDAIGTPVVKQSGEKTAALNIPAAVVSQVK